MFCCLKMRWENLITFCEERPSWHRVSILSMLTKPAFFDTNAVGIRDMALEVAVGVRDTVGLNRAGGQDTLLGASTQLEVSLPYRHRPSLAGLG